MKTMTQSRNIRNAGMAIAATLLVLAAGNASAEVYARDPVGLVAAFFTHAPESSIGRQARSYCIRETSFQQLTASVIPTPDQARQ